MLGVDLLGGFLCLLLGLVHIDPFQLVRTAVNLCDGLQDGIGVLRRHGVELTHALLSVEVLDGAQVWIQLIDNAMDFQIREPGIDLICRIDAEGEGNTLAALLAAFCSVSICASVIWYFSDHVKSLSLY